MKYLNDFRPHPFVGGALNSSRNFRRVPPQPTHIKNASTTRNNLSKLDCFIQCSGKPKTGDCKLEMNLIIIFLKKVLNLLFTLEEKFSLTVTKIFAFGRQTLPLHLSFLFKHCAVPHSLRSLLKTLYFFFKKTFSWG